ncbi:MAG: RIP metalloprotease RseP [Sulfurovaceae bacterium]|nr:RIP metalloprotease RseP [Sulfurovaceae bacterium]
MGILISVLVLSLLIFFHEFGHFTAAKFFGVRIEVFSIGFGKKLYSKMIGNTQWSISAIPLGGYVRMKGQDDADPTLRSNDFDSYTSKKPWQRIIILLAGPFANFILAFVLYMIIAFSGIPKLLPYIGEIAPASPAMNAGLHKKDIILSIDNQPVYYWEEIGQIIQSNKKDNLLLQIKRDNKLQVIIIKPKTISDKNIFGETVSRKVIGIAPLGTIGNQYLGALSAIGYAYDQTIDTSLLLMKGVEKLITGTVDSSQVGGVITIIDITSQASNAGFVALLFFTALISINLGVLNLLPIPALDGGHIMFNLYEMIRRKAPNEAVLYQLTLLGWILLIGLMFLGLYNDINRLWR